MQGADDQRVSLESVLSEIDADTRLEHAATGAGTGLDQQLRDAWSQAASQSMSAADSLHERVATVERHSQFALVVPAASNVPGAGLFKRLVRKAVSWYVRFFVAQFQVFATAVTHALAAFEQELRRPRDVSDTTGPPLPLDVTAEMGDDTWWWDAIALEALRHAPGAVLHIGRRSDGLVDALRAVSVDASRLDAPDPWAHHVHAHLALVAERSLGGIVLEGPVQWAPPAACDRVLAQAATRLAPGGIVLVASATPLAWSRSAPPVLVDLAPGHPLHPETWAHLMARHGLGHAQVHRGGATVAAEPEAYVVVSVLAP